MDRPEEDTFPEPNCSLVSYGRAMVEVEVKAIGDDSTREILHLITMGTDDRAGDVVDPDGIDLRNYKRNPVVLVDHDYRTEKIIGRATEIERDGNKLYARTKFRETELGEASYQLAKEKIGGWSIGFRPLEYEARKDAKGRHEGYHFTKVDMLEYSLVAIPMHQDVVNNAICRGLITEEQASIFFKIEAEADPPKPEASAVDKPNVEADPSHLLAVDTALSRASRKLERDEAAKRINTILGKLR